MNVIDFAVIFFLLVGFVRGAQVGFIRQFLSTLGFGVGIFAGIHLGNIASQWVQNAGTKTIVSSLILFAVSFGLMSLGEFIGVAVKQRISSHKAGNSADSSFGIVMSGAASLLALWFITAFIALMPLGSLQKTVRQSYTFNFLDQHFPPASELMSSLNHYFHINDFPLAFSGREPAPDSSITAPPASAYTSVFQATNASVVRVQGLGCGGLVNGSGFLLSSTRVLTNAHVVAGIKNPTINDKNGSHSARVVIFDPKIDLAVLATSEPLDEPPLPIASTMSGPGNVVLISGYPGGGPEHDGTGVITSRVEALGRDIYNQSKTIRDVYVMQATIIPGNSGGPVMNEKGEVTGIVFGTSTTYNNVGYALTLTQIKPTIDAAAGASQTQSTGACSQV